MAIPQTTDPVVEIIMLGIAAAAGGTAKNIANVYHFRRNSGAVTPNKTNVESAFNTSIAAPVIALLNVRYTQSKNTVRLVNDTLDMPTEVTRAGVGAITGDSMAAFDTGYVKETSAVRGKRYRGNKKYGPMSESDSTTTSDVFNAGCLARFATLRTAVLAGFTDSDGNLWKPCIYSRMNDSLVTKPAVAAVDVVNFLINHRIGRLRRREVDSVY